MSSSVRVAASGAAEGASFSPARLLQLGGLAMVASLVSVLVIRAVAVTVVDVPSVFSPLNLSDTLTLTALGVAGAVIACLGLNAFAKRPVRTFRAVAWVVLLISFAPDISIWAMHSYSHSARAATVIPLLIMHLAVGLICLVLLPRATR